MNERDAEQRPVLARGAPSIRALRLRKRRLRCDGDHSVQGRVQALDPGQKMLRQFNARNLLV
jgi:hypothetical protein